MMSLGQQLADSEDVARKGIILERTIKIYQDSISAVERCSKPVIMAVHQACIGAGVDLITAADIRYSTQDAFFQVRLLIFSKILLNISFVFSYRIFFL